MSAQDDAYTARQYKPTYSYNPHPCLPLANRLPSMSTSQRTYSPHSKHSPIPSAITLPQPSYNRRRTTSNLPNLDPQHSLPTVASSGVTASASTTAGRMPSYTGKKLSDPPPSYRENVPSKAPSRIPTPVWRRGSWGGVKEKKNMGRIVSSPVVSTSESLSQKENKPLSKLNSYRLQGIVHPPQPLQPGGLTKSHTLSFFPMLRSSISKSSLISLTTSKSKQNLSTTDRKSNRTSIDSTEINSSFSNSNNSNANPGYQQAYSLPAPAHDVRHIMTAMPSAYWTGRFVALQDRLLSERLDGGKLEDARCQRWLEGDRSYDDDEVDIEDASLGTITMPKIQNSNTVGSFQNYLDPDDSHTFEISSTGFTYLNTSTMSTATTMAYSPSGPTPPLKTYQPNTSRPVDRRLQVLQNITEDPNQLHDIHSDNDKQTLALRVFLRLESQCLTDEAKKSLTRWQQNYARFTRNEALLPPGGSMVDEARRESLVSRARGYFAGGGRGSDGYGESKPVAPVHNRLRTRGKSVGGTVWGNSGMNIENRRGSGSMFVVKGNSGHGAGF